MIPLPLTDLRARFGERLQTDVLLARYTSARVGGPADALILTESADELAEAVEWLWAADLPFKILGGASNVLVSDAGMRGTVILNRAHISSGMAFMAFNANAEPPSVWVESGVHLAAVARRAAQLGLAGLEWAAGIPGTVGGAVVGNAGAYHGDMAGNLLLAEILQPGNAEQPEAALRQRWPVEKLGYSYRSSILKHAGSGKQPVVLAAQLKLAHSTPEEVQGRMEALSENRRRAQPPGASMGSMFRNPPGDYAGRLVEAAGLKSTRIGDAQISPLHANFFINLGNANAADIYGLIQLARNCVVEKFGIVLELEIELVGEWV